MRMHRYRGKENGLMIIGTSSELRALGQSLIAAAENPPAPLVKDWPPEVAEVAIAGVSEFSFSFHLEAPGSSTPKSSFP
jgi:hypothetical protein